MTKKIAAALSLALLLMASSARAQRFIFTGVPDAQVLSFFDMFQKAVGRGDRSAVASMVNYPLRVNSRNGNKLVIAGSAELIRQYDIVFTPSIRQAIVAEKPARLTGSRDGVAVADGLVWLSGLCTRKNPGKCTIGLAIVNHE